MKLWQNSGGSLSEVENFTTGKDRIFDTMLAPFDVLGSIAHVKMLSSVELLTKDEEEALVSELKRIYYSILPGDHSTSSFQVDEKMEDIHSQVEWMLTQALGDIGKKIHSARSRNDQVLLDIKLYLRHELEKMVTEMHVFFSLLQSQSEKYKEVLLPGFTHLQLAMPSSFGLWLGAYAESLADDMVTLKAAFDIVNKNPLGSAAGYGSSFPINRKLTTELLGFDELDYNVVYAQMGRGKTERIVAQALANVADTLSRLSMDVCLYLNPEMAYIHFPDELTTGSSIMPHKKNPDVFELIRSHCNRIRSLPNEILMMTTNLPSGYHRDLQLLKEHLFPAFETLRSCLYMAGLMMGKMEVRKNILDDKKYKYLFSVEEVNKWVLKGMPFREAYLKVRLEIENGTFTHEGNTIHTHEGSMGNLCNKEIAERMDRVIHSFSFMKIKKALKELIS